MTVSELLLLCQALVETALKLHKDIVSGAALSAFIDKEKGFAVSG
jgi:hypothetical protein